MTNPTQRTGRQTTERTTAMSRSLTRDYLRRLRNDIPIRLVIAEILELPWKIVDGRFRFLCPHCREFDTGAKAETNLARCFRCGVNFNPIDLVMIDKRLDFLQAVEFLDPWLDPQPDHAAAPTPSHHV